MNYSATADAVFENAMRPACAAIATELAATPRGHDHRSMDLWESLRLAQLETHKSFALSLNGMFESNFRSHLWHSAAVMGWKGKRLEDTQAEEWSAQFEKVRGFPFSTFPTASELQVLALIGNAVRHGNGRSAQQLHDACPDLFLEDEVTTGWFSYFAHGAEPRSSVRRLFIPFDRLESFKTAIVEFWQSIRALQLSAA